MTLAELLNRLGYSESENYLRRTQDDFGRAPDYGHVFRKAAAEPCNLQGVYALKGPNAAIPAVYVCDVESDSQALDVHRLVWNQGVVPFIIINSPTTVRVYPGFCRGVSGTNSKSIQTVHREFDKASLETITKTLGATAVDTGATWRSWGRFILPEHRIDWRLLDSLRRLDIWLQKRGLDRDISHALIGKYVYLHYLRDRQILSPKKFERFGISRDAVFGRGATLDGLAAISYALDEWLNGEVFPLAFTGRGAPQNEHVSRVAATFSGDQPLGDAHWQLHLDFKAYDFSYIPIEVLSIVYEQFLHAPDGDGTTNRGRQAGAYYTPIPVVNLMLSEVEERLPLKRGMRVFDPACGSGAFLVQAFRRLIEREFPPQHGHPSPVELRELVERHFYGLDTDPDACNVARLSLILTLLDYVYPPDLEMDGRPGPNPRLPNLRNNIFHGNFFDKNGDWQAVFARKKADWVVGNPPWKQLKQGNIRKEDEPVLQWMSEEERHRPVGNRQSARAFAWRAADYVNADGEVALFLPAMTLFEKAAKGFRRKFLKLMQVRTLVNFSNLRWVISAGRFTAPAAAFFYRPRPGDNGAVDGPDELIRTYSPLVANQEATRPKVAGKRNETWSIVINASEIRDIPLARVSDGAGLPWKVAFWGSECDMKLLRAVRGRFATVADMEERGQLRISEGLQLREEGADEDLEAVSLPQNAMTLDISSLKGMRDFFALPSRSMIPVPANKTCVRKGRGDLPLSVCRPPHVLVSAARNFAVYSDEYCIVPPRQIGIASPRANKDMLKALSVFLSSDFARYFEFLMSTELGVDRDRSTLSALRGIPMPLATMTPRDLKAWAQLHDKLAQATRRAFKTKGLWQDDDDNDRIAHRSLVSDELIDELNELVYDALALRDRERSLIHDMVRVRLALNDGRLGKAAVGKPNKSFLRAYAVALQTELDAYIYDAVHGKHSIGVIHDEHSGMVRISLAKNGAGKGKSVAIMTANASEAASLRECRARIRQERSQWVYFDRNLRIYEKDSTYVMKPMQRFHWTPSQARADAMEIVAESMARRGEA